jgi:hypothetical protein
VVWWLSVPVIVMITTSLACPSYQWFSVEEDNFLAVNMFSCTFVYMLQRWSSDLVNKTMIFVYPIQDILYILHIYFVNKTLYWPVAETLIKHNCQLRLRWSFNLNGNAQELISTWTFTLTRVIAVHV